MLMYRVETKRKLYLLVLGASSATRSSPCELPIILYANFDLHSELNVLYLFVNQMIS